MSKNLKRQDYGLQQFIMEALINLQYSNTSRKFLRAVGTDEAPGYYQRIKQPMDLGKIVQRFKSGFYTKLADIKASLDLIISNCEAYNVDPTLPIRKKSQKFQKEIAVEMQKVYEGCKQKQIDPNTQFVIDDKKVQNYQSIQQRKTKKRINIQIGEIMSKRISKQSIKEQIGLQPLVRPQSMQFNANMELVRSSFQSLSQRKLQKYQKLIKRYLDQLLYFLKQFIKNNQKLQIPRHLINIMEQGQLTTAINIRKSQLFIKQLAYWVKKFHTLIQNQQKYHLVKICHLLLRCIKQIMTYRDSRDVIGNSASSSNIPLDPKIDQQIPSQSQQLFNYDSKMKQFRRMLDRDEKCLPKTVSFPNTVEDIRILDPLNPNKKKKASIHSIAPTKFQIKMPNAYQQQMAEDRLWVQQIKQIRVDKFGIDLSTLVTGIQRIKVAPFTIAI